MGRGFREDKMLDCNTIYHGDTFEWMNKINDKSVDMILVDPPYGTTRCKFDTVISPTNLWSSYNRILKDNCIIVMFGTEPFSSIMRCSNLKQYKYDWIWDKVTARGHLVAKKRPMQQTENIMIFGGTRYYPQMVKRPQDKIEIRKTTEYARTEIMGGEKTNPPINKVYDTWYPKTLLVYSNAGSSVKSVHPNQKPVLLLEYLLKTYSLENDIILDNCAGAMSLACAADNLNRKWICIEQEEKYCSVGLERVNKNRERLGLPLVYIVK